MMGRFVLVILLSGCSPQKPSCTPESRDALRGLYEHAAGEVISSGACDQMQRVEDCPAYMAVEAQFTIAEKALCQP